MRVKKAKRRPGRPEFIPSTPTNAAPSGAKLRATLDAPNPFGMRKLPAAVTDAIAERKLTGGYDVRKSNVCGTCFTARSRNGSCECRPKGDLRKVRNLTPKAKRSPYADLIG